MVKYYVPFLQNLQYKEPFQQILQTFLKDYGIQFTILRQRS